MYYDVFSIDLTVAQTDFKIDQAGSYCEVRSIGDGSSAVSLKFDSEQKNPLLVRVGDIFENNFTKIFITNTAGVGNLLLVIGSDYNFRPGQLRKINVSEMNHAAQAIVVGVAETALPLVAQGNRFSLWIHNNGANTVFLGNTGVLVGTGFPLAAGDAVIVDISEDLIVYGIAAANCEVRIWEFS